MSDDIIERAEAALADDPYVPLFETEPISPALRVLIPELLAALKAAREHAEGVEHDRDFLLRELEALAAKLAAS